MSLYYIVLRTKWELGDVLRVPVLVDHDDVVLPEYNHYNAPVCPVCPVSPVSPGPRLPLGDGDHGLHGDDHPGPDHRVNVLSQLQTRLPPVIVTQHTKAVTIAE